MLDRAIEGRRSRAVAVWVVTIGMVLSTGAAVLADDEPADTTTSAPESSSAPSTELPAETTVPAESTTVAPTTVPAESTTVAPTTVAEVPTTAEPSTTTTAAPTTTTVEDGPVAAAAGPNSLTMAQNIFGYSRTAAGVINLEYGITVTNHDDFFDPPIAYQLTSVFHFGAGVTVTDVFLSSASSGGPAVINVNFDGSGDPNIGGVLEVEGGAHHDFTIHVTATVDPGITPAASDCVLAGGETGTGLSVGSSLTWDGGSAADSDCAVIEQSAFDVGITASPASIGPGDEVTYTLTVTNARGSSELFPAVSLYYAPSDSLLYFWSASVPPANFPSAAFVDLEVPGLSPGETWNGTVTFFLGNLPSDRTLPATLSAVHPSTVGATESTTTDAHSGPFVPPTAPTNLQLTAFAGLVRVTWDPPVDFGSTWVYDNNYEVERATSPLGPWTTVSHSGRTHVTLNVPAPLYFRVRAQGAVDGPYGPILAYVAPRSPGITAAPGASSVTLNWTPPASTAGLPVTSFIIRRSTSPTGGWSTVASNVSPTARSYNVTGLTNGVTYYFRIAAVNAAGPGTWSSVVNAMPRTVPSAPPRRDAIGGNHTVTVQWGTPGSNGGLPLTGFVVQRSLSGDGGWVNAAVVSPNVRSLVLTGLSNGRRFFFRVAAINAAGVGPYGSVSTAVTRAPMSAPLGFQVMPGRGVVFLSWRRPVLDDGFTTFIVQRSTSPTSGFVTVGYTWELNMTATGLVNGTRYYFRVAGVNSAGIGEWSRVLGARPNALA